MRDILHPVGTKAVACMLLLSSFFCFSCSSEEDPVVPEVPEVQYAQVTISLGTVDNATPAFTKAGENDVTDSDYADAEYERHIEDWWVVILDNNNKVYNLLSNTLGDDWTAVGSSADNEHEVAVDLVIGETYSFYAFANLNSLASSSEGVAYIKSLTKGSSFEVSKSVLLQDISAYHTNSASRPYIPMSSYASDRIQVQENNNKVALLLIRLLGKVSVEVTNSSVGAMTLKSLTVDKFRQGAIYLLPYDAAQGKDTKNLLASTMESSYCPVFPASTPTYWSQTLVSQDQPIQIEAGGDKKQSFTFYANETDFTKTGQQELLIQVGIDGRNEEPIKTHFSFIRRNDWLKIPITISNAEVQVTSKQIHMPIGGIPASLTFGPGAILAVQDYYVDHAGDITFDYELTKMLGDDANGWSLKYYNNESYQSGDRFCCVQLVENPSNLILTSPEVSLPWLGTEAKGFRMIPESGSETKGSFTLRLQELVPDAETSTARIKLTLVATNGTNTVILPYYINIKFGSQPTTGEGA